MECAGTFIMLVLCKEEKVGQSDHRLTYPSRHGDSKDSSPGTLQSWVVTNSSKSCNHVRESQHTRIHVCMYACMHVCMLDVA